MNNLRGIDVIFNHVCVPLCSFLCVPFLVAAYVGKTKKKMDEKNMGYFFLYNKIKDKKKQNQ